MERNSKVDRYYLRVALCLLALTTPNAGVAEKTYRWETATVVSQDLGSDRAGTYRGPLGAGRVSMPINLKSNFVVVDTGVYRYTLQEFTRSPNWHHFVVLTLNDEVKFYRDGQWFMVQDSEGKKHKFALVGAVKK